MKNYPVSKKGNETDGGDHDNEIFDDDDFYHQLLRDLIEKKAAGGEGEAGKEGCAVSGGNMGGAGEGGWVKP